VKLATLRLGKGELLLAAVGQLAVAVGLLSAAVGQLAVAVGLLSAAVGQLAVAVGLRLGKKGLLLLTPRRQMQGLAAASAPTPLVVEAADLLEEAEATLWPLREHCENRRRREER
jgi:hypothetical protein